MSLRWQAEALEAIAAETKRLEEIAGERSARAFVTRIRHVAEQIQAFPEFGRAVPEFRVDSIRGRIVGEYRLMYRIVGNDVELLTLIHGSREVP